KHSVEYRQDAMNEDEAFSRVRVRRQLLPLLRSFNGRITEALGRTADLLRDDRAALDGAATVLLSASRAEAGRLRVDLLAIAPAAVRRRALRHWISQHRGDLRRIEMVHILALDKIVKGNRGGVVIELPGGTRVKRTRAFLEFDDAEVPPTRTGPTRKA